MDDRPHLLHLPRLGRHRRVPGNLCRLQRRQPSASSSGTRTTCTTSDASAQYTEANYTAPFGDKFSLAFHAGYAWGDAWEAEELIDYAVQLNYTAGNFTIFGKFTGTDASEANEYTADVNNNEPRFLVGVMTTFPWGD